MNVKLALVSLVAVLSSLVGCTVNVNDQHNDIANAVEYNDSFGFAFVASSAECQSQIDIDLVDRAYQSDGEMTHAYYYLTQVCSNGIGHGLAVVVPVDEVINYDMVDASYYLLKDGEFAVIVGKAFECDSPCSVKVVTY